MDPVDDILTTMGLAHRSHHRVTASAPWGVAFSGAAPMRLVVVARGRCVLSEGGGVVELGAGDCLVVRGGAEFVLSDVAERVPAPAREVLTAREVAVGGGGAGCEVLVAAFSFDAVAAEPLLPRLPDVLRVSLRGGNLRRVLATVELMVLESGDGFGSELVLGKLGDVLLVQVMRAWCAGSGDDRPGWLAALHDPRLSLAMRAMHGDLAHPWTVASLAGRAGMSRSAFAAAFRERTGESPLAHLTYWRMHRAKALLREGRTLQEIAVRVGYETDTALSRAFRRAEGVSPGRWRGLVARVGDSGGEACPVA
ncbi:AraC family transcriptional regulator [Actinosynnema pretiosum subsp. pretiosum]|uniref:AraC family transcriptional regulator n=1 Tax=Actinosynnema pretiosum subsp. pretiosum TaxID=103721 RepID=A0AA45L5T5_9PSEU|nr:AraC family transcriptional regulator [Actinosynnema pretiosum subsp. pretiosum]QUF03403.1 AraC family transcriptional regulator [Actinosynnema pretiosum subsp. pretiosum]